MDLNDFVTKFADQLDDTPSNEITAQTKFQELDEWDSMTALIVISFIKLNYDKTVSGVELRNCQTIEDLFNLVESK